MVGFRYFRYFSVFGIPTSVSVSVFRNIAISVIFFGYRAALLYTLPRAYLQPGFFQLHRCLGIFDFIIIR